jgi:hypothetical protein
VRSRAIAARITTSAPGGPDGSKTSPGLAPPLKTAYARLARPVLGLFRLGLRRLRCPDDHYDGANPFGRHVDAVRRQLQGLETFGKWPQAPRTSFQQETSARGQNGRKSGPQGLEDSLCWQNPGASACCPTTTSMQTSPGHRSGPNSTGAYFSWEEPNENETQNRNIAFCQFEASKLTSSAGMEGVAAEQKRAELETLCMQARGALAPIRRS